MELRIENETTKGIVFFNSGRVVDAVQQDMKGEQAFYSLLALKGGLFDFQPSTAPFPEVFRNNNTFLILEGLRLLDEASRDLKNT